MAHRIKIIRKPILALNFGGRSSTDYERVQNFTVRGTLLPNRSLDQNRPKTLILIITLILGQLSELLSTVTEISVSPGTSDPRRVTHIVHACTCQLIIPQLIFLVKVQPSQNSTKSARTP
jgi:hypothetical protein